MKKLADEVRGVPLGGIRAHLERAGIEVETGKTGLRYRGNCGLVEIEVLKPAGISLDVVPLRAVVVARTRLHDEFPATDPTVCAHFNRLAAMGALTPMDGKAYVVSRLTTYEGCDGEDWELHGQMIAWAASLSPDAMDPNGPARLAGMRSKLSTDGKTWPTAELADLQLRFGHRFACSSSETSFTAEVSLRGGSGAAASGDDHTALIQMSTREQHPALGPGLHVLLQMPHRFASQAPLNRLLMQLNAWEARADDMVPHYGAWCPGQVVNPAYTCFIPAHLWRDWFVQNLLIWMVARARQADGLLVARGFIAGFNEDCGQANDASRPFRRPGFHSAG